MLPMFFDFLLPRNKEYFDGDHFEDVDFQDDVEETVKATSADTSKMTSRVKYGLVLVVILGDVFHNFCDMKS